VHVAPGTRLWISPTPAPTYTRPVWYIGLVSGVVVVRRVWLYKYLSRYGLLHRMTFAERGALLVYIGDAKVTDDLFHLVVFSQVLDMRSAHIDLNSISLLAESTQINLTVPHGIGGSVLAHLGERNNHSARQAWNEALLPLMTDTRNILRKHHSSSTYTAGA
jgi:hypothetical protein